MLEDWSDERLMLAYRDGDMGAFEALYQRYRGPLYRHLAHQCGNSALAEELYQDIWIKVVGARSGYEPLARFSTWVYRIAHNCLIDHYRKHARESAARYERHDADDDPPWDEGPDGIFARIPGPDQDTPHARLDRQETARRIGAALADLPEPQREAFLLAEEGELSLEEIAAATGTGRETVKSRLRYALGKLRHSLEDLL